MAAGLEGVPLAIVCVCVQIPLIDSVRGAASRRQTCTVAQAFLTVLFFLPYKPT
jgi:hypothetical protein